MVAQNIKKEAKPQFGSRVRHNPVVPDLHNPLSSKQYENYRIREKVL